MRGLYCIRPFFTNNYVTIRIIELYYRRYPFMRIKVISLMTFLALASTINTQAVDIQVPAGNRPLSSADSSIPANTYETYTTGSQ